MALTLNSVATDNFNRASLGGNWAQLLGFTTGGDIIVMSNTHMAGNTNGAGSTDVCWARYVGTGSFTDDHYSENAILGGIGNNGENYRCGVLVRAGAGTGASRTAYGLEIYMDGTGDPATRTWRIFKTVTGTKTVLTSGGVSCGTGTRYGLAVVGSNIYALKDRVQVLTTQVDTAITTGLPGVLMSGGSADPTADNWEAGTASEASSSRAKLGGKLVGGLLIG